ncbi:PASTA domain-containing protein [Frankia sp. AiPs1]
MSYEYDKRGYRPEGYGDRGLSRNAKIGIGAGVAFLLLVIGIAAGGGGNGASTASSAGVPGSPAAVVTDAAAAPAAAAPAAAAAVATSAPAVQKAVPNVVGMNHQTAQDTLQAAGFYNLAEQDATGQGRFLVLDRNWHVVSQSPAGGTVIGTDSQVMLRSKKYTDP